MRAEVSGRTLFVSGASARPFSYDQVTVSNSGSGWLVIDNDQVGVNVPISGDATSIAIVDFLGLSDSGVNFYSSGGGNSLTRVNGSNFGDYFGLYGENVRLYAAGGDDRVNTNSGNDSIWGGLGHDDIRTGSGNDVIYGQQGNDFIDGGEDYDTLVFTGNRNDYQLDIVEGTYRITHLIPGGQDGIDTFGNIEALRFADQTVEISPSPTNLSAEVSGRTLFVSGASARPFSYDQVTVSNSGSGWLVIDNDQVGVNVPISGDATSIAIVDFLGLSDSGVNFYSSGGGNSLTRVNGSNFGDYFGLYGENVRLYAAGGDDRVNTNSGNDSIWGGLGHDDIRTGSGNDVIYGQQGNDFIDGGEDYDTLVFTGNRNDYQLDIVEGTYRITHLIPGGQDGIDTFGNIEALRFADQTVEISPSPTNLSAEVSGRTLFVSGASARPFSYDQVTVSNSGSGWLVIDNDQVGVNVPISGDATSIAIVDFLGLSDSGVNFYSSGGGNSLTRVNGSNFGDYFGLYGENVRLYAAGGDDRVNTNSGNDSIWGGLGHDDIRTGSGNDVIYGQQGNDFIDGGEDYDTLVFTGNRNDYQLDIVEGTYRITHLIPGGQDGIDTFGNIEALRFADQTVEVDQFLFA